MILKTLLLSIFLFNLDNGLHSIYESSHVSSRNIYIFYNDRNCKDCFKEILAYYHKANDTGLRLNVIFPYHESSFTNKLRVHTFKKEIDADTSIKFYFSTHIFDSLHINITPAILEISKQDTALLLYTDLYKNKVLDTLRLRQQ